MVLLGLQGSGVTIIQHRSIVVFLCSEFESCDGRGDLANLLRFGGQTSELGVGCGSGCSMGGAFLLQVDVLFSRKVQRSEVNKCHHIITKYIYIYRSC